MAAAQFATIEPASPGPVAKRARGVVGVERVNSGFYDVHFNRDISGCTVLATYGKTVAGDYSHAIVAIGIVPNTENIGLEKLGVKTTKGHIDTDGMCRTNVPGLWAIGDVTAPPWLAHKASHEGVTAAEAIAKELGNKDAHPHATDPKNIPGCTYCRPQVASVGLT